MSWFSSVQSLSRVRLLVTLWTAACQSSLSITNSQSLLKLMSTKSVMPSNHLILCLPLLLLPSIRREKSPKESSASHPWTLLMGSPNLRAGTQAPGVWSHPLKPPPRCPVHKTKGGGGPASPPLRLYLELMKAWPALLYFSPCLHLDELLDVKFSLGNLKFFDLFSTDSTYTFEEWGIRKACRFRSCATVTMKLDLFASYLFREKRMRWDRAQATRRRREAGSRPSGAVLTSARSAPGPSPWPRRPPRCTARPRPHWACAWGNGRHGWTVANRDTWSCGCCLPACVLSRFGGVWLSATPMDCSPPGSSAHWILQARTLEGLPCPPPGDLPNPGIELASLTSPCIGRQVLDH